MSSTTKINNDTSSSINTQNEYKVNMRESLTTPHSNPSNPFAFTPDQLAALHDPKNIELLHVFGGLEGVAKGLHADIRQGLNPNTTFDQHVTLQDITLDSSKLVTESSTQIEDINEPTLKKSSTFNTLSDHVTGPYAERAKIFGANVLPPVKSKSIFQLMWLAFNDKTLVSRDSIYDNTTSVYLNLLYIDFTCCGCCSFIGCWLVRRYCCARI
jgi:Ca2+-transporting ATPase